MTAKTTRLFLTIAIAPLALGLAACKADPAGDAAAVDGPKGDPVAAVAPPAGKAWADVVEATPDGGMRMGNPAAPVKLIEYGSLTCPHCAKLSQEGFGPLVKNYVSTGKVSFEFRSFAIHPQDVPLTVLVRCAPQEAFFPLVEQIYTNFNAMNAVYGDKPRLDQAEAAMALPPAQRWAAFAQVVGYTDFFAARGVAKDQANACLSDLSKATLVADQAKKYGEAGINGTPAIFINGAKVSASEWPGVEAALKAAGAR
jgi:protein-disulfide isomerase